MKRINGEDISTVSPTLGFNIKTMEHNGCYAVVRPGIGTREACCILLWWVMMSAVLRRYRLNVWDVGGQRTIRSYWRNYYESTDGLIWVVDSADVHRMQDCAQVL